MNCLKLKLIEMTKPQVIKKIISSRVGKNTFAEKIIAKFSDDELERDFEQALVFLLATSEARDYWRRQVNETT